MSIISRFLRTFPRVAEAVAPEAHRPWETNPVTVVFNKTFRPPQIIIDPKTSEKEYVFPMSPREVRKFRRYCEEEEIRVPRTTDLPPDLFKNNKF